MNLNSQKELIEQLIKEIHNTQLVIDDVSISHPMLSIITPFYNSYLHFEETFHCVINQSFQDFEWIIVDDSSNDLASIQLLQDMVKQSKKMITFKNSINKGPSWSRNFAVDQAKGKYLFFIDSDDIIDFTYLEKCILFLESHPEFSFANSYSFGFGKEYYFWNSGFDQSAKLLKQNFVTSTMIIYRKEDFIKLGGFDENLRLYEDWERWLKALCFGQRGWTIPENLVGYRRREDGLLLSTLQNSSQSIKIKKQIQRKYKEDFSKQLFYYDSILYISPIERNLISLDFNLNNSIRQSTDNCKILFIFPWLEVGGADKFNLDLVSLLKHRSYDITIATTLKSTNPWHHLFHSVTPDIFHLPNFLESCYWLSCLKHIIRSRNIEVVFISNSYVAYYFLPFLRHEFPLITFIDLVHCADPGWRGDGYPRLSCKFYSLLDAQVVTSKNLADYYLNKNPEIATNGNLKVCYTNVDPNKLQVSEIKREKLRKKLKVKNDEVILLYPARLEFQKRPWFLVKLIKELTKIQLPIKVVILGKGSYKRQIKWEIFRNQLQKYFIFLPPVSPDEMIDFYSASDIFLLPSAYEGLSVAIYEAMSMRLPIVASDVGGQGELVINNENGYLIPLGDKDQEEIKQYIDVLLPLIKNKDLRNQIGNRARQQIENNYTLDRMADNVESIIAAAKQRRQESNKNKENYQQITEEMLILALSFLQMDDLFSQSALAFRIAGIMNKIKTKLKRIYIKFISVTKKLNS